MPLVAEATSPQVVALGIELSAVALSGPLGQPALDYHLASALSSPYGNRTHLSALKGQYPSPIDERAELCVSQARTLSANKRAVSLVSGKPTKKARRLADTGPYGSSKSKTECHNRLFSSLARA
jgi:hypothetical protein